MRKIDKDKPLPNHTKLKYDECVAKFFLEYFFEERYGFLTISDKPDLYSEKNDIGIEVTKAVDPKIKEAEKMWFTIPYLEDEEEKNNHIQRMEKLGVHYISSDIQVWPVQIYNDGVNSKLHRILYLSLKKKLEKIKSGQYRNCKKYDIFILGEMKPKFEWLNQLNQKIINISSEIKNKLSRVYLLSQGILQVFDTENRKPTWINTNEQYCNLVCKARKLVEEAEEN